MHKVLKAAVIVAAALGVLMAVFIACALYDHEAFRKVIVRADQKMHMLGGGVTNGRRSAERVVSTNKGEYQRLLR
jgi:hypothetical protein